jgi:hypothetical protein
MVQNVNIESCNDSKGRKWKWREEEHKIHGAALLTGGALSVVAHVESALGRG